MDTTAVLTPSEARKSFTIRPIVLQAELQACVALQQRTWGEEFGEVVPRSILKIAARLGGIVAGAFDEGQTLLGFVFGLTGVEHGKLVHWSHMLAVAPEAQNHGIGRALKAYQRAEMARLGAQVIYWTFDPLVARNAHLNFNVLGVRVVEYVENMYGVSASPRHRGIGTDRLVVAWPVSDDELDAGRSKAARTSKDGAMSALRVEIPGDIEALLESDITAARAWREETRRAFQRAFDSGYVVHDFHVDRQAKRAHYLLSR